MVFSYQDRGYVWVLGVKNYIASGPPEMSNP